MKPQFIPRSGIGSRWVDPKTNAAWKFTKQGWVSAAQDNIQEDVKEKNTFQVQPEEEPLLAQLKQGGASEEQIQESLAARRNILAKQASLEEAPVVEEVETPTPDTKNPFGGMTKKEMIRDAFNKGVRDSGELEKLGDLYDLMVEDGEAESIDMTKLTPVQRLEMEAKVKEQAVAKMQALPDAVARENTLGALSTFDTGRDIIAILDQGKVKTGPVAGGVRRGIFGLGARKLGKTTEEEDYFAALTETFAANYRKAMSGTAVSAPEMERLDQFLPSETKTEQANIEGIMALSDYLSNRTNLQLGMDVSGLKPQRASKDPLNIFNGTDAKNNPLGI